MKTPDAMAEADPLQLSAPLKSRPFWDGLIAFLFVLAIAGPLLTVMWSRTTMEFENRTTEPWPEWQGWSPHAFRTFATAFERAFNDRFGGRDQLVRLNNNVQAVVFRKSPSTQVIIGRDNWLFVKGNWTAALRGLEPYPHDANVAIAEGISARARFMREHGIDYRMLYSPDKHTIYPENLPDKFLPAAKFTRIDDILASLSADVRSLVVDLRAPLLAVKTRDKVFLSTDSHWNSFGAWVGYSALARSLGIDVKPYASQSGQFITTSYAGDLARMMGADGYFNEVIRGPDFFIDGKAEPCRQPISATPNLSIQIFECPNASLEKVIIYRDSFGLALGPYVSALGRQTIMVSNGHKLDTQWVREQRPTLFVDQIVERGTPNLALPSMSFGKAFTFPAPNAISDTFTCSTTAVAIEEGTGHPAMLMRSEAKYADANPPPDKLWYVLEKDGDAYAAEAMPAQASLVTIFGRIDRSTFNLLAGEGSLRPGSYKVTLVGGFGGRFAKCPTGIDVNVTR